MGQNIIKDVEDVNVINQHNLTEIYRIFHTTKAKYLHDHHFLGHKKNRKKSEESKSKTQNIQIHKV